MMEIKQVLHKAYNKYGKNLMATTGFGYSGIVLLHHIKNSIPEIPIYFIDTGEHFQQTLNLVKKIEDIWNINIKRLYPEDDLEVDYRNPTDCCYHRKTVPLLNVINDDTVWISALRRDQSASREDIELYYKDSRGTTKICPLYNWSKKECWKYINKHDLPYNPLYDEGYTSIGCKPCTTPTKDGEMERAGRWRGTEKQGGECGIHESKRNSYSRKQ